jgi:hypothetical protein
MNADVQWCIARTTDGPRRAASGEYAGLGGRQSRQRAAGGKELEDSEVGLSLFFSNDLERVDAKAERAGPERQLACDLDEFCWAGEVLSAEIDEVVKAKLDASKSCPCCCVQAQLERVASCCEAQTLRGQDKRRGHRARGHVAVARKMVREKDRRERGDGDPARQRGGEKEIDRQSPCAHSIEVHFTRLGITALP